MIQLTRTLTFEEFAASNKIALLHSGFGRRLNTIIWLYVVPSLAAVALIPAIWALRSLPAGRENAGFFILLWGLIGACVGSFWYPFAFRRKLRRSYRRQELDQLYFFQIDPEGIQSRRPGKFETKFDWSYFDRCIETSDQFTLIQSKRLTFIAIPKSTLTSDAEAELRGLLSEHVQANNP